MTTLVLLATDALETTTFAPRRVVWVSADIISIYLCAYKSKAYLFLTLAAFFWSGNFIVGKAASIYEIPPFSLNFYRWLFAFLILLPFTYKEVIKNKNYIFQNLGFFFILGITSITIFNSIVYYSLYYTQVISGVLMISTIRAGLTPTGFLATDNSVVMWFVVIDRDTIR